MNNTECLKHRNATTITQQASDILRAKISGLNLQICFNRQFSTYCRVEIKKINLLHIDKSLSFYL